MQVEDIIDTGATLKRVVARLQEAGAASVKVPYSHMRSGGRSAMQATCTTKSQLWRLLRFAEATTGVAQAYHQRNNQLSTWWLRWRCCLTRRLAGRSTSSPTTALYR